MRIKGSRAPLSIVKNMLHTPDVLRQIMKSGFRKRLTAHLDYRRKDGYSGHPIQVDIKITNACNLRCKMCGQWGESGYNLTRRTEAIKEVVSLDVYKRAVDQLSFKPWIYIWGGEPFLYPDLLPLLRYMKMKDLVVTVVTNGTKIISYAEELLTIGTDVLMLSLDGRRDIHDRIRGVKGTFDRVMSGVQAVQEEKKKRGSIKPYIILIATVSTDNAHNLDEVFDIGEKIHADGILVYYGWFQTRESGRRQDAIMKEKFNIIPESWRGYIWSYNKIDTDALLRSVKRIKSRTWKFAYQFIPELDYEDIPRYYQEPSNLFGFGRCVNAWTTMEILPNGDVTTCRDYPDCLVGNIKESSINDIWNGDQYRKFRTVLKGREEGLFPICARCCGLMGL